MQNFRNHWSNNQWTNVNNDLLVNKGVGQDQQTEAASTLDTSKTWEIIDWEVVRESTEATFATNVAELQDASIRDEISQHASDNWEKFYQAKNDTFFQKRNYLHFVFPELMENAPAEVVQRVEKERMKRNTEKEKEAMNKTYNIVEEDSNTNNDHNNNDDNDCDNSSNTIEKIDETSIELNENHVIMEVGAGTGSSLFSIAALRPDSRMGACDLSSHAIQLIQKNKLYDSNRFSAFVWDFSRKELPNDVSNFVQLNSCDIITAIFALSAIDPDLLHDSLTRLYKLLKPGGILLIRDYGLYDMTQVRFHVKQHRRLAENYYVRGDQTTTYFFSLDDLSTRCEAVGFKTERCEYDVRKLLNRKRKLTMYRVWIQFVGRKPK